MFSEFIENKTSSKMMIKRKTSKEEEKLKENGKI